MNQTVNEGVAVSAAPTSSNLKQFLDKNAGDLAIGTLILTIAGLILAMFFVNRHLIVDGKPMIFDEKVYKCSMVME